MFLLLKKLWSDRFSPCFFGGGGLIILILLGWIYSPALSHGPRADQWFYLADTMEDATWSELIHHSYSYNRTRFIFPGDTSLFRPGLFFLMAVEKYYFGSNFFGWQLVGLLLHGINVGLLFYLLGRIISPAWSSPVRLLIVWLGTAYFAFNYSLQELVIWSHLHGYLFYITLFLLILVVLIREPEPFRPGPAAGRRVWWLSLVSVFFYELGLLVTVLLAFLFLRSAWASDRSRAWKSFFIFNSIIVIYFFANVGDWLIPRSMPPSIPSPAIAGGGNKIVELGINSVIFVVYTLVQPLFPFSGTAQIYEMGRVVLPPMGKNWSLLGFNAASLVLFGVLSGVMYWKVRARWGRGGWRQLNSWWLFLGTVYLAYGVMIVVGRMMFHELGCGVLSISSYYTYFAQLLFLLVLFFSLPRTMSTISSKLTINLMSLSCFLAVVVIGASMLQVWRLNRTIQKITQVYLPDKKVLEALIQAHGQEPDFSFARVMGKGEPPGYSPVGVPYQTIFYRRYENPLRPKYLLYWEKGTWQWRQRKADEPWSPPPFLYRLRYPDQIYCYQDRFYLVSQRANFLPDFSTQVSYRTPEEAEQASRP